MEIKKSCSLYVGNVPKETTNQELEDIFGEIGPLKRCFLATPKANKNTTIGFVEYALQDDADTAVESFSSNFKIKEKSVVVQYSKSKSKSSDSQENLSKTESKPLTKQTHLANIGNKKARVIIRNLSFKTTEEKLQKHLSKFGELFEIKILKKKDGLMIGCAFAQFQKVPDAAKAIKEANAKPFLGRPIAIDWAVPKHEYNTKSVSPTKENADGNHEIDEDNNGSIINDIDNDGTEDVSDDSGDDNVEGDNKLDRDHTSESDEEESKPQTKLKNETGHDVNEGKTIFIQNISYGTVQEDLHEFMENYGKVGYAVVCKDKVMERSKGTAFVKFVDKKSVENILKDASSDKGLELDGRKLNIMLAKKKSDLTVATALKKEKVGKNSRNLHLAREGMVRPGTLAAKDVSQTDMALRLRLDQFKRNTLKNLNMFFSPYRLCIRNLPPHVNDKVLKSLIKKHAPEGSKITETRVMCSNKSIGVNGKGVSKGYGFVTFTKHEHALVVLRKLNNNPEIFTAMQRPVIEFSLENRVALKAKERRLEKSKEKNPNYKIKTGKDNKSNNSISNLAECDVSGIEKKSFMGSKGDAKIKTLPSHSGAKVRTAKGRKEPKPISRKMLKKEHKEMKKGKRKVSQTEESEMPDLPKKAKKRKLMTKAAVKDIKEDKKFSNLVSDYKAKLLTASQTRKKWYE